MRRVAVTTVDDLKTFFSTPPWAGLGWSGRRFEGSRGRIDVKIRPSTTVFHVSIVASDDPTDSEEMSTEEPMKAIADFLGRDIPGGEHFERMSSDPDMFADALDTLASAVRRGIIDRIRASSVIRRLASIPACVAAAVSRGPSPDTSDLPSLEKEMKSKGWQVTRDGGRLEVDIHGLYEASIEVDSILYECEYGFRGESEHDHEETTDDPIRDFRKWYHSPGVKKLLDDSSAEKQRRRMEMTNPVSPA